MSEWAMLIRPLAERRPQMQTVTTAAMATRVREPGEFCWFNMLTPRPPEARAFFNELFGWTYSEIPELGDTVLIDGRPAGGLFDLHGERTPPGTLAHIGVMVKVDSADAAAARVRALGGEAREPFDILGDLRMAVCSDPEGASFDLWESKQAHGTEVDGRLHGAPGWFELVTHNDERSGEFYSRLFGWQRELMPSPFIRYTTFKQGSSFIAGMMQATPEMAGMRPSWVTYFTVDDADKTARLATALGASVCIPPTDIPGVGRFCGITSPQGVGFCVIKYFV
jgi:predicted enzyme related to lactoylglutathione lyase